MIEITEPLFDKNQTAREIKKIVNRFYSDLNNIFTDDNSEPLSDLSLSDYFDLVRCIKYRRDTKPIEVVSRPYYILKYQNLGMDCKKKTILMASWCKCNDYDYRYIASSNRADKKIHHIFPQIFIDNDWKNIDATYPQYKLFQYKNNVTNMELL
jgi:hypothetical protein